MKQREKWPLALLPMLLLLFLAGLSVSADGRFFGDTFVWEDGNGNRWSCAEYGEDEAGVYGCRVNTMEVTIPTQVVDETGKLRLVTAVVGYEEAKGEPTWDGETFSYAGKDSDIKLRKLILPDTVNYIGKEAFRATTNRETGDGEPIYNEEMLFLQEVIFPQNPELVISEQAFEGCINLSKITFRAEVGAAQPVTIGEGAFKGCTKLTEVVLPSKTTFAADWSDDGPFENCTNLTKIVNAPGDVLDLGDAGVSSLKEIYYAEGVESVGGVRLSKKVSIDENSYTTEEIPMPSLTKVVLPSSLKQIETSAFSDCANLREINLPAGLQVIGGSAFSGCSNLSSLSLPAGLQRIDDRAFMGCRNLHIAVNYPSADPDCGYDFKDSGITSISFGTGLKSIFPGSLSGCKDLKEIKVAAGHPSFSTKDGILYVKLYDYDGGKSLFCYPAGKSWAGSYTIPAEADAISGLAFDSCKFTEIHIPVTTKYFLPNYMASLEGDNSKLYDCFDNMIGTPKLYGVKGSYADDSYNLIYEAGPAVSITYQLNGGKNHTSNKSSIVGGSKLTLYTPSRSGYEFLGWKVKGKDDYVKSYQPSYDELFDGVTFTANWKKKSSSEKPTEKPSKVKAPGKVGTLKLTNAQTTSFKASYSKVSGARGYQVAVAANSKFTSGKKTVNVKGSSVTIKGLKPGKTYYVKVRAYKKDGKKTLYGKYSPVKKIQTISVGKIKKLSVKNPSKGKLALTAYPVKGAKGYQFLISTDKNFKKNRKVITAKKRTASVTKLSKGRTYYIKARAYKVNAQKQKVYGSYTKAVKIKVKR